MQTRPSAVSAVSANLYQSLLAHAVVRPERSRARHLAAMKLVARAEHALDELDEAEAMSHLRGALRVDPRCDRARSLLDALTYATRSGS